MKLLSFISLLSLSAFAGTISPGGGTIAGGSGSGSGLSSAQSNILANATTSPFYDDYFLQTSTNFLSPFGTLDWETYSGAALASYHGGEVYLNEAGYYNSTAEFPLAIPVGTTNVSLTGNIRMLSGSGSVQINISNATNTTPTVTTSWQAISIDANAAQIAAANTNLLVKFFIFNTPTLSLSNLQITCRGSTDVVLSNPFKRYMVSAKNLAGESGTPLSGGFDKANGMAGFENLNMSRAGSHSVVDFKTDATNFTIEASSFANNALGYPWVLAVYKNSQLITNIYPVQGGMNFQFFTITTTNSGLLSTYRVVSSFAFYNTAGNYVRAVLVPPASAFEFVKKDSSRKVFLIGDSILADNNNADAMQDVGHLVETYIGCKIINYAQGSGSLYSTWSYTNGGSIIRKTMLARALADEKPTDIYMEHGINDLGGGNFYGDGTNGFSLALGDCLDSMHELCPQATIYCQSILYSSAYGSTGAGTGGYTIKQYRDAQQFVSLARSNYVVFLNASNWLAAGDLQGDGIHPTSSGTVKYAAAVANNIWTNRVVPTGFSLKLKQNVLQATNTLTIGGTGLSGATNSSTLDTYLISVTAGTGLSLKDPSGTSIITPILNMPIPLKPKWYITGTAMTVSDGIILNR